MDGDGLMPDPAFQEDPELLAAIGGGGAPQFQEDSDLLAALQGPRPANQQEANGPAFPAGGRVTELPTQQIQGDPHAGESGLDAFLRSLHDQEDRTNMMENGAAEHGAPGLGGMIYGASAHALDPMREARLSASPGQQRVAELAGNFASPIGAMGVPARGAGLFRAGVQGAAAAGLGGGIQRAADDPNATAGDIGGAAIRSAAPGFLFGAGAQSLSKGLAGYGVSAGNTADEFRNRAAGMPESEATGMPQEALAARAKQIEDAGLVTRPFQSPAGYARNAQALAARGDATMRPAENAIAGLPEQPSVPVGDVIDAQRAEAQRLGGLADMRGNSPQMRYRNDVANRLEADAAEAGPNGELPWARALEQRRNFDANTKFGANPGPQTSVNAARREVGNDLRGAVDQSLNSPNVPPELANNWRTGRDQYALGSQVNDQALKALGQGGQVPTNARDALGFAARRGGLSAVADTARAAQGGLGNVSGFGASPAPPGAAMTGGNQALQSWMQSKGVNHNDGSSQGGASGNRAMQALQVNPQVLGKYADQFQEAERTGGSEAVNALINKLTFSDPEFRMGPGALLSQGGQNGQQ
jgi:hypothetical protein